MFIKNGLSLFDQPVSIMEIGFGTGLNSFITFLESERKNQKINYTGVEAFPVSLEEVGAMNYVGQLKAEPHSDIFNQMHSCSWDAPNVISGNFTLTKRKMLFEQISDVEKFDLIYFDAFGFRVQPELWSTEIFQNMYNALKPGGILVTYAARGAVKRSMIAVGFTVEKLDGPPGKREMFRAAKRDDSKFNSAIPL